MSILDALLNAQGGGLTNQLGQQFGLDPRQTESALGALLPTLAGAVQQNVQSPGGLDALLGALNGGGHNRYVEQPELVGSPDMVDDGNGILGHLFGSKDVSRSLANQASAQTGIGADVLKRMLPVVASLVMGALASRAMAGGRPGGGGMGGMGMGAPAGGGGLGGMLGGMLGGGAGAGMGAAAGAGGGLMGMLGPLLDRNRNGTPIDDVLSMAAGFLGRR